MTNSYEDEVNALLAKLEDAVSKLPIDAQALASIAFRMGMEAGDATARKFPDPRLTAEILRLKQEIEELRHPK